MKTFTFGRKNIGTLDGDTFSKDVIKSRHLFRVLDAWGIDSTVLNGLPEGTKIVIHEQEENKTYTTTKELYLRDGQYYHFKVPRKDHRTQLFLPRRKFQVEEPKRLEGEELAKYNYMVSQGLI